LFYIRVRKNPVGVYALPSLRFAKKEPCIYPKVLIINGEPFNKQSATGITMSNLFRGWPQEKIAQVYSSNITPDNSICQNNWHLGLNNLIGINQLMRRQTACPGGKISSKSKEIKTINLKPRFEFFRKQMRPWLDLIPYRIDDEFWQWLYEYRPEVIYTLLGNIRLTNLVNRISEKLTLPVVPHFMDDWLATYSVGGRLIFTAVQRIILKRRVTMLLHQKVSVAIAICDFMAEEYSRRFGIRFEAFMNSVSVRALTPIKSRQENFSKMVRFVYIGGLHLNRWQNLLDIAKAMKRLRSDGVNACLIIFAPLKDLLSYDKLLSSEQGVEVGGSLLPEEVQDALVMADVAVHVESFLPRDRLYTRLSISTKIPQYMSAARPILAYGPAEVASCRYINDCGCGVIVSQRNFNILEASIRHLVVNVEERKQLGKKGWDTARRSHDQNLVCDRFRALLSEAALRSNCS